MIMGFVVSITIVLIAGLGLLAAICLFREDPLAAVKQRQRAIDFLDSNPWGDK